MLIATAVSKTTLALFLLVHPNFGGKSPDYQPPVPKPERSRYQGVERELQDYRKYLFSLESQWQRLEHQPGDNRAEVARLVEMQGFIQRRMREVMRRQAPPGPGILLVTPDQLRELRGLPPIPRKVRD